MPKKKPYCPFCGASAELAVKGLVEQGYGPIIATEIVKGVVVTTRREEELKSLLRWLRQNISDNIHWFEIEDTSEGKRIKEILNGSTD